MDHLPGFLLSALLLSVLFAAAGAWGVAALYRRRMLALMRGGPAPDASNPPRDYIATLQAKHAAPPLDLAANRRAGVRLLLALAALSLLVGLTQSAFALHFVYESDRDFSAKQWLVMGLIYAWPMLLAWGLLRRWSWPRMLTGVVGYFAAITPVVLLASNAAQTLQDVLSLYGILALVPLAIVLLIGSSGRIRAIAPYLLPVFLVLLLASQLGLEFLAGKVAGDIQAWPGWLQSLTASIGARATMALFAVAPWLFAAWPVYALGRSLAQAYRAKRYSDLAYLFALYWLLVLVLSALTGLAGVGAAAFWQLLAWLWIPLGFPLLRRWLAPASAPATLLVLRVFQRDAQVEALFDRVVERWRLTGNTVLIAGTDLLSRTLDPDDLFTFLNGRLADRFIASAEEIPRKVAEMDLRPDPDGRYRVNEFHCFDSTWQPALRALVEASDVVLMDLRGCKPENRGCRFELRVLAGAPHLRPAPAPRGAAARCRHRPRDGRGGSRRGGWGAACLGGGGAAGRGEERRGAGRPVRGGEMSAVAPGGRSANLCGRRSAAWQCRPSF